MKSEGIDVTQQPAHVLRRVERELKGDVSREDSQRRFLAQHSDAVLEQCWKHSTQYRNNVVMLCCAKNRRCESSPVTTP